MVITFSFSAQGGIYEWKDARVSILPDHLQECITWSVGDDWLEFNGEEGQVSRDQSAQPPLEPRDCNCHY